MDHGNHVAGALGAIAGAEKNAMNMGDMTDMPGMGGMTDMPGMGGMTDMPGMGGMTDMSGMTDMTGMCMCMDMDMDGMKMYFHAGTDEVILFDFWRITKVWELLLSMLGIFVIAFLYEGLKYYREHLFRRAVKNSPYVTSNSTNVGGETAANGGGPQAMRYYEDFIIPSTTKMMSLPHAAQTCLHMLQFFVAYLLMLIFMTYNVWLCLAVLLGSGTGYFVFGWRKAVVVDLSEHCH